MNTTSLPIKIDSSPGDVLRNTLGLLALSMVPTVIGAWVGMETSFGPDLQSTWGFVAALVIAVALIFAIQANRNRAAGVPLLLGFTFFMGLVMSGMLGMVLSTHDGAQLVMTAFAATAGMFAGLGFLASRIKRSLRSWGTMLFVALLGLLATSVLNLFLGSTVLLAVTAGAGTFLFSLYVLYDLKRVLDGDETSYISATLAIYLDLVNIFSNVLSLLGISTGKD